LVVNGKSFSRPDIEPPPDGWACVTAAIDRGAPPCHAGRVTRALAPIAAAITSASLATIAPGCTHYEEPRDERLALAQPPDRQLPAASDDTGVGVGVIAGEVRVETVAVSMTVAFETVGLYRDGQLLATCNTDGHGRFRFAKSGGELFDDGLYELALLSDRYRGTSRIQYSRIARRVYRLSAAPR
jgi:hypothetical protein